MTHKLVKYSRPGAAIAYRVEVEGSEVGTMWFVKDEGKWYTTRKAALDAPPGTAKTRAKALEAVLGTREPLPAPRAAPRVPVTPSPALREEDDGEPRAIPKMMTEADKKRLDRIVLFNRARDAGQWIRIVWKNPLSGEVEDRAYRPITIEGGMLTVDCRGEGDRVYRGAIWPGSLTQEIEIVPRPEDWPTSEQERAAFEAASSPKKRKGK